MLKHRMTRNLYLGTDLIPIALAADRAELKSRVAAGFKQVPPAGVVSTLLLP